MDTPRLSRRHLFALTMSAPVHVTGAQDVPPPHIDLEIFRALCEWVTGIAPILYDEGLHQVLDLLAGDPDASTGLPELLALQAAGGEIDPGRLGPPGLVTMTNLLQYWHLGWFRDAPLPNLERRFGGVLAWRALPYATNQTICKEFGAWATDPGV